jgi:hypothetical protein
MHVVRDEHTERIVAGLGTVWRGVGVGVGVWVATASLKSPHTLSQHRHRHTQIHDVIRGQSRGGAHGQRRDGHATESWPN